MGVEVASTALCVAHVLTARTGYIIQFFFYIFMFACLYVPLVYFSLQFVSRMEKELGYRGIPVVVVVVGFSYLE